MRTLGTRSTLAAGGVALLALGALCVVLADDPARGVRPGADAGDPRCGRITERVPRELGGRARDGVDLPGVAVWGDGDIVLRCGAEVPAPSVDPCFEADGVDWVMDLAKSTRDRKVVVTYGRRPATEVTFAAGLATTDAALLDLSAAVAPLVRQTDRCIGPADVR